MNSCGSKTRVQPRSHGGFTLIEVVVVVVIVGILAMVALPAYQDSVRRGQRSDAKMGLMAVAGRMEQYMLDRGTYTDDMEELGYDDNPMITTEKHYSIKAEACSGGTIATCYRLTATPLGSSPLADDTECKTFVLANTGVRDATGTHKDKCWK